MFVTFNQTKHTLRFQHDKTKEGRDYTTAFLSIYDEADPRASATIASGTVCRHSKDQPCRETARKAAIAKALRAGTFTKEERRAVWTAYLNRKSTPKPTPVAGDAPIDPPPQIQGILAAAFDWFAARHL